MAGMAAHDMPQLPQYKDKKQLEKSLCCFVTTSQLCFSWCLSGECHGPIIISWHWCGSNNIECSLYGNSLGAYIFSPGNLLMTALVVNTVVSNDIKRFSRGLITFLHAKCLLTLVINAMQKWRSVFPFLVFSLLYAIWLLNISPSQLPRSTICCCEEKGKVVK